MKAKLLTDIREGATGDHPELLFGTKGDIVMVKSTPGTFYDYKVIDEKSPYGVNGDEIEIISV